MFKLNAKQLRKGILKPDDEDLNLQKNEVYLILDNILDTYNIGSIFRLADALAVKKVYLCGGTATPPNHRIIKASVNTIEWVQWEYCNLATKAITKLKSENPKLQVVAIEQSDRSVPYNQFDYQLPLALVVGHESSGVSKEALDLCDVVVELPMFGVNISLNVMVSLAIVLYKAVENIKD